MGGDRGGDAVEDENSAITNRGAERVLKKRE